MPLSSAPLSAPNLLGSSGTCIAQLPSGGKSMRRTSLPSVVVLAGLSLWGCDRAPPPEPERADTAAVEKQAAEQRERSEEAAELERRAANLQSRFTEMQTKVQTRGRASTAGLREEVAEDVKNATAA